MFLVIWLVIEQGRCRQFEPASIFLELIRSMHVDRSFHLLSVACQKPDAGENRCYSWQNLLQKPSQNVRSINVRFFFGFATCALATLASRMTRLTRQSYNAKVSAELLDARPRE